MVAHASSSTPTSQALNRSRTPSDTCATSPNGNSARRTREQRCRPHVLALLDEHFTRLGLLDPQRHVRIAIAGYSLDAILAGLAIFDAKKRADTLPEGVDARYLLGIVRNVAAKAEGEHFARAMLDLRIEARDRMLAPLLVARDAICTGDDAARVSAECIDRALASTLSPSPRPPPPPAPRDPPPAAAAPAPPAPQEDGSHNVVPSPTRSLGPAGAPAPTLARPLPALGRSW